MRLTLLLSILLMTVIASAQSIKLTNTKSGKSLSLPKGTRVVYTLKGSSTAHVGILTDIKTDQMVVDSTSVSYDDLTRLGRRKKGSAFGIMAMSFIGGSFIGAVVFPGNDDPCPQCQTVSVEDEGGTAGDIVLVTAGVTLVGLALNSATKNSARKLGDWKLEVVE